MVIVKTVSWVQKKVVYSCKFFAVDACSFFFAVSHVNYKNKINSFCGKGV